MQADQAAGLRRRQTAGLSRFAYSVGGSASGALRLARALRQRGLTPLVVDTRDRLFAPAAAQALFDWPRQLDRGQLLPLPLADVLAWHAPGCRANAPGLAQATRHFDGLIFDATLADVATPAPRAHEWALLTVQPDTMHAVYALLKTRAPLGGIEFILTGDADACERVREACVRFLSAPAASTVRCIHDEVDAIAALAIRMAHEEPGCQPRYKTTGHP